MYSLGGALYWMKQLFIIKVIFIENGCYFSSKQFFTFTQSQFFSHLYSKISISKRVLLLRRTISLREVDQKYLHGGEIS